jgi:hypothetical protein
VKLLSESDIAANLNSTLQRGGHEISPPFEDVDEVLLAAAYCAVRFVPSFGYLNLSVVHGHEPAADLLDIEKVSPSNTAQERLIFLHFSELDYLLCTLWHVTTLSSIRAPCNRSYWHRTVFASAGQLDMKMRRTKPSTCGK